MPASVTELARVGLFADLTGETLTKLADRMEREEVASGTVLIREGEPGDRFFVLLSGIAGVTQSALGERRILRAGEFFGEVALAMHVPRTATVTAMTPCVVASCDEAAFEELVRAALRRRLAGRARRGRESAKRGHAVFAQSPNARVVRAAQTTRASGSTQRNVPVPPKCPNVRRDVRLPIHDGGEVLSWTPSPQSRGSNRP